MRLWKKTQVESSHSMSTSQKYSPAPHYCFRGSNYLANFFDNIANSTIFSLKIKKVCFNYHFTDNKVSPNISKIKQMGENNTQLGEYVVYNNLFDNTDVCFCLGAKCIDFEIEIKQPTAVFCYSFLIEHAKTMWHYLPDKKELVFFDPLTPKAIVALQFFGLQLGNKMVTDNICCYIQATSDSMLRYIIVLNYAQITESDLIFPQCLKLQLKVMT